MKISLKLTVFRQIHLLINASVLFHVHRALELSGLFLKNYLTFAFLLVEVGECALPCVAFDLIHVNYN